MDFSDFVYPDFVRDSLELHNRLWQELAFVRHPDRPRNECWMNDFGSDYTYGSGRAQRTYPAQPWHPAIREIRRRLGVELDIHMDSCFINGYLDGHDHLGWHADDSPEMDDERPIVVVSLGIEREIWFRPKDSRGEATAKLALPSGSALVMPAGMQDTHQHRIPRSPLHKCPARISLTFRGLIAEATHASADAEKLVSVPEI